MCPTGSVGHAFTASGISVALHDPGAASRVSPPTVAVQVTERVTDGFGPQSLWQRAKPGAAQAYVGHWPSPGAHGAVSPSAAAQEDPCPDCVVATLYTLSSQLAAHSDQLPAQSISGGQAPSPGLHRDVSPAGV